MMIPVERKTKPLPLSGRGRWVFEFLTSVMLMCVKYNDDSCWKESKTSSTLLKKALGLWIFDISNVERKKNLFHSLEEGVGSWCAAKLVQVSKRHSLTLLMEAITKRSWSSKRNDDHNDDNKWYNAMKTFTDHYRSEQAEPELREAWTSWTARQRGKHLNIDISWLLMYSGLSRKD